jgi:hypothetical protein
MSKRAILLFVCFASCAAARADESLRQDVLGNWRGRVTQPGAAPYSVELSVRKGEAGKLVASTVYPELGCRGVLTLVNESSVDLRFLEKIDPQNPRCVSMGHVYLVRAEKGVLAWGWTTPSGALAAQAQLEKVGPVAAGTEASGRIAKDARTPASKIADKPIGKGEIPAVSKAIDGSFVQWAKQWMMDRYIPDSLQITETEAKSGVHLVRGTFRFSRGSGVASIPFASTLRKQDSLWLVSSLCYNDVTTGMTDCANSAISAGARQFLGLAILGGLFAAISGYESPGSEVRDSVSAVDAARREREEQQERKSARQRETDQLDKDWSRMFEESTLLPPPRTLN